MKLVIDIPEDQYTTLNAKTQDDIVDVIDHGALIKAIKNGTPLPKGHGRLGDLDKIWLVLKESEAYYQAEFLKESNVIHQSDINGRLYGTTKAKFIVQDAPTIIEADTTRDCKTCGHSNDGKCAGTEECHECMWVNNHIEADKGDEQE